MCISSIGYSMPSANHPLQNINTPACVRYETHLIYSISKDKVKDDRHPYFVQKKISFLKKMIQFFNDESLAEIPGKR